MIFWIKTLQTSQRYPLQFLNRESDVIQFLIFVRTTVSSIVSALILCLNPYLLIIYSTEQPFSESDAL